MENLKFTKQTRTVALVFAIAYTFYGLFRIPFVQYLVSLAVGGIAFGISECYEIAALAILLTNFLYPFFGPKAVQKEGFRSEGFSDRGSRGSSGTNGSEGFTLGNDDPEKIKERLAKMRDGYNPRAVVGVASPISEGFENPQAEATLSNQKGSEADKEPVATGVSTPAPAETTDASGTKQGFADNGGLFKLGAIPSDAAGGFHIDAGTTVINALNALKPDQINAMTKDTQSLIETQKSLMSMLKTFSPMLQEGKQMMDTFNTMFAPTGGVGTQALETSNLMLQGKGK
jgi:hypothetical protein